MSDNQHIESLLKENGITFDNIISINEGSNHEVYIIKNGDDEKILKMAKTRSTEQGYQEENRDTMYNGPLSMEREIGLLEIIYEQGLPAPKIYQILEDGNKKVMFMEKCPGKPFLQYVKDHDYDLERYLDSLYHLGKDFAKLHELTYPSFGNLIGKQGIYPSDKYNFKDYFQDVVTIHLQNAYKKGVFNDQEYQDVISFIDKKWQEFAEILTIDVNAPTFVITDMHANNYFVDEDGVPSGYFDVESTQAAPASFEFYGFEMFLFNLFDEETQLKARLAFYQGYKDNGGKYMIGKDNPQELVDFFSFLRVIELTQSYWGYIDGIRDTWGYVFKDVMINFMQTNKLDYLAIGDIFRMRDHTPKKPFIKK